MKEVVIDRVKMDDGLWDIDHPESVDEHGERIRLIHKLMEEFPGQRISTHCHADKCTVKFHDKSSVSSADNTKLTNTLNQYKSDVAALVSTKMEK